MNCHPVCFENLKTPCKSATRILQSLEEVLRCLIFQMMEFHTAHNRQAAPDTMRAPLMEKIPAKLYQAKDNSKDGWNPWGSWGELSVFVETSGPKKGQASVQFYNQHTFTLGLNAVVCMNLPLGRVGGGKVFTFKAWSSTGNRKRKMFKLLFKDWSQADLFDTLWNTFNRLPSSDGAPTTSTSTAATAASTAVAPSLKTPPPSNRFKKLSIDEESSADDESSADLFSPFSDKTSQSPNLLSPDEDKGKDEEEEDYSYMVDESQQQQWG